MIKSKEDLSGCYAERADKEVFELFMQKCDEFGIKGLSGGLPRDVKNGYCVCYDFMGSGGLGCASKRFYNDQGMKQLTLSDFKHKKIRTEWVKAEDDLWQLEDEFKNGDLYWLSCDTTYKVITKTYTLTSFLEAGEVYRKVEKEIDWRIEATNFIANNEAKYFDYTWSVDGVDLTDIDFIKLCHLVVKLTDKPEGLHNE